MKILAIIALCLMGGLVSLAACSPTLLLNTATPSSAFSRQSDISFGDGPRHNLDLYRAAAPREGAPVIVFIHGGGWTKGSKDQYKFVADAFTRAGYDMAIVNYRLYPDAAYPAFLEDNAAAVARMVQLFPDRKLVLMGHSAGAYNVAMLGLDAQLLEQAGVARCEKVVGIIGLSGPYGLRPVTDEPYVSIFPDKLKGDDAPINIARKDAPPFFLVSGGNDKVVNSQNTVALAETLISLNATVTHKLYAQLDHVGPVRVLSRFFDGDAPVREDILAWLDKLDLEAPACR